MITRTWTGPLLVVNAPFNGNRVLELPGGNDRQPYHLPTPLCVERDGLTVAFGEVTAIYHVGNELIGHGTMTIDPDTTWGQQLLNGDQHPVRSEIYAYAVTTRSLHWTHAVLRATRLDRFIPTPDLVGCSSDWSLFKVVLISTNDPSVSPDDALMNIQLDPEAEADIKEHCQLSTRG